MLYLLIKTEYFNIIPKFLCNFMANYSFLNIMKSILEICAGDIASVKAAAHGGAERVELCSALGVGGLTPSEGFIREAARVCGVKIHVLIRPREGHFVFSDDEVNIMLHDIDVAADCGASGVVIGALNCDGKIDTDSCRRLVAAAKKHGLSVTFHRAFDQVADAFEALEAVIELGCDRILTSGLAPSAIEGAEMLRKLNEAAAGRITLIAAAGVNSRNAADIIRISRCHEIHASARHETPSPMSFVRGDVAMGAIADEDFKRKTTDINEVKRIKELI